ncbi:D-alanyl-D-alanine carboxypeptidase family protein [Streptomyces sp. NPDC059092]|uniref:D-alanyl-D-alanine carboxypeptidase family protein n=1 Tax=Streptomyces sp. NPDC059092 TaxID=3346725 RepID=UPI0036A218A6
MIIRSVMRSALSGTAALAAGLLVLLPASHPAAADSRTDPVVRAPGLPEGAAIAVAGAPGTHAPPGTPGAPGASGSAAPSRPAAPSTPARAGAAPAAALDGSLLRRDGVQVLPARGAPAPPEVSALSWLVADARTGDVLAARDAHRELPPASTLKTLFAVTTLPRLSEHAQHLVTDEELDDIGPGSSLVGVVPGVRYEAADLWRGVFLSSGNDAVRVLSEMNGGLDRTVKQMRDKAKLLGALDTHVVSPDGYDAPGQVSSAYDLAVFGRTGLASPDFVRYSSTVDAEFPGYGGTFGIMNTNRLLTGADGVEAYPGLIGVKNGYTTDAGYTLVAAARHGDRTLLVTVMNPQWGGVHAVYEEARELLDWGFGAHGRVTPVGSLQPPPAPLPPRPTVEAAGPEPGAVEKAVRAHPVPSTTPAVHARAAGSGAGGVLPVAFICAAALSALALFLVRRGVARRDRSAPGGR